MHKNKACLFVIITFISILPIFTQNNTNSPYTRFGFGELSDNNSGDQRAMGGVAIGARSKTRINTVNPASYSISDSLTFMFDLGLSGLISRFSNDANQMNTTFTGNLDYITMQFRLFKGVGLSAGILPYSFAGYNYYTGFTDSIATYPGEYEKYSHNEVFSGTGGISQFYIGLAADLFNHVSLGANVYYMFGSYNNSKYEQFITSNYVSSTQINSIKVNKFRFRIGAQVYNTFADKHEFTLGLIYEPKTSLNANATQMTYENHNDTVDISNGFELPQMFGGGLYYKYDNKLSVGLDYSLQQWKNVEYYGQTDTLSNRHKLSLGVEYQPNYRSRKFGQRLMYRAGLNMTDPYYRMGNEKAGKNFGITFGVGIPLRNNNRTMLNMAFEYGKVNSYEALKEDYFKFTFNFAFTETWFFKRKL